jgi:hypothetical protein
MVRERETGVALLCKPAANPSKMLNWRFWFQLTYALGLTVEAHPPAPSSS